MDKTKKIVATLATLGALTGGVLFVSTTGNECKVQLNGVTNDNIIEKMIEYMVEQPVDDVVNFGCDLEEKWTVKGKALQMTENNCKSIEKEEYIKYRSEVFYNIKNIDKAKDEAIKGIVQNEFAEVWNYHLFKSCEAK